MKTYNPALAIYNDEVGRGIVHTPEYTACMVKAQQRYDKHGEDMTPIVGTHVLAAFDGKQIVYGKQQTTETGQDIDWYKYAKEISRQQSK